MKMGERCLAKADDAPEIGMKNIEVEVEIIRFGALRNYNWELNSEQRKSRAHDLKNKGK